jgi:hypothetical protein
VDIGKFAATRGDGNGFPRNRTKSSEVRMAAKQATAGAAVVKKVRIPTEEELLKAPT